MSGKPIDEAVLEAFQDAMESAHGYRPQVFATGVLVNSRDADRFDGYQLALTAAQQGHPASEYVGATAKVRDCTCRRYDGRDCRKCFRPPYPDQTQQQGQASCPECGSTDKIEDANGAIVCGNHFCDSEPLAQSTQQGGGEVCPRCGAPCNISPDGYECTYAPPSAPVGVEGCLDRLRQHRSQRLWQADLVGGQISVERMRAILHVALAQQPAAVDALDREISVWAGRMSARGWEARWPEARAVHNALREARRALATQHQEPKS